MKARTLKSMPLKRNLQFLLSFIFHLSGSLAETKYITQIINHISYITSSPFFFSPSLSTTNNHNCFFLFFHQNSEQILGFLKWFLSFNWQELYQFIHVHSFGLGQGNHRLVKPVMSCLCGLFGKNSVLDTVRQNEDIPGVNRIKIFSYNELRKATDGFSVANKIGEGGFGSVYKGKLKDGTFVAVKVLSAESRQGVREFLTELTVISDINHENLVRLHGCCVEGTHRILVYPYMENNSLAQTLLGRNPANLEFNWKTRVKLCIGVARGLAFLHDEIRPPIIHRDIKASNVLLDKDLTPKISDFGLAKLLPPNATHVSTRVAGTIGYLAPEYAIRGQVTRKSDIYSFGVLLLEIVSGRCNTNTRLPYEDQFLLERTWTLYEQGNLEKIVDAFLNDLDMEEATRFLKVALLCTQDATRLRPSMSTVLKLLTGDRPIGNEKITKPAVISDFMDLKVKSTKENQNFGQVSTTISSSAAATTAFSSEDDTTLLSMASSDKDFK